MPYLLEDLVIDRVDLVNEGANSAAFIEVFKRKESEKQMEFSEIISKMKPEHASVIQAELDSVKADLLKARTDLTTVSTQLSEANEALATANGELNILKAKECTCDGEADENGLCKACGKPKKSVGFDEMSVLKGLPESVRSMFIKMREQKEAAEAQLRKSAEAAAEAAAISKAETMKALPIEQAKLVAILKTCDNDTADILKAASDAIDAAVLGEVGKNKDHQQTGDAWAKLDAKATEISTRDSVTKQKAIAIAVKENPDLYREYLNGGAK